MFFISDAYAQAAESTEAVQDPSAVMNLLPLILIFAVFYVFLIRPQQKKLKEHETVINSINRGDEVVTGGGIIGKVNKVEEGNNIALIEIAEGVIVRVNKATIIDVVPGGKASEKTDKSESKSKANKKTKSTKAAK